VKYAVVETGLVIYNNSHVMAIMQVKLLTTFKNWRTLLKQSVTVCMPLLAATSIFKLKRKYQASPW